MSLAKKLKTWSLNQLISEQQREDILLFEKNSGRSRLFFGLGGLGVLSIILGFVSLIAANWDLISPETKIASHVLLNLVLAFVTLRFFEKPSWVREVLIALQAGFVMTFIALIGQVLQTQAPLWKPLGFWLLLTTPLLLLYARFSGLVAVWLGIVGVFSFSLAEHVLSQNQAEVFLAALPFILFIPFGLKKINDLLPHWADTIQKVFWVSVVCVTTATQIFWHDSTYNAWHVIPVSSVLVAGIGTLIVFLLNCAQRNRFISFWKAEAVEREAILVVSYILAVFPILLPHPKLGFVGAMMFCLYWLFMGGIGLRLGTDRLWSLAVVLIGIRLFVAYVEIMGSLALQGIGFIVTGLMFLGFAWGIKKIIQSRPTWLLAQKNEGGRS